MPRVSSWRKRVRSNEVCVSISCFFANHSGAFIEAVRTVLTTASTAIAALQMISLCENKVSILGVVKIFRLELLRPSKSVGVVSHFIDAQGVKIDKIWHL